MPFLLNTIFLFILSLSANLSLAGDHQEINHSNAIPAQYQSYSDRPDILSVEAKSHSEVLPEDWEKTKWAHLEAISQYLEIYKDFELYFLGRDAELLHDLAKLVASGIPQEQERIHLINVSRANMNTKNVREYLSQNGISEKNLATGKKILFIDTGFSGTIPLKIMSFFPKFKEQFSAHLITSSNSDFPSTRVFLYHLNALISYISPHQLHGTVINYEHIPRYTDRSNEFVLVGSTWHAISPLKKSSDGVVDPKIGLMYQQDLKLFWSNPDNQAAFLQRRAVYQWLQ
jgi:hypothetical protein